MISMSGMVEVHFLTSTRKCKFIGRLDHLNALPVLPQGIKRHFIMKPGEQVKVDLPCGFYKVTAMDENYREISVKYDRGTSMKLKEAHFCDKMVEKGWTLSAYLTEIPQNGYDPYVLTKWTR